MDCGVEPGIDKPDCLVSFLAIGSTKRRQNHVVVSREHRWCKTQSQTMFGQVGFVLGRIEFELHMV